MKKYFGLVVAAFLINTTFIMAQGFGGGPRLTVQERLKLVNEKLVDFKLDNAHQNKSDSIFTVYYTAIQKQRDEMVAAGGEPDRDARRANMQKLSLERDNELKTIFTDEQFKKWKNDIEPTMRPQRSNRQ